MKTLTNTVDAIAIDLGAQRIKIAYFHPKTHDVEVMRFGQSLFIPSYFCPDPKKGSLIVGEQAENMLEDPEKRGWVRDMLKRDIFNLGKIYSGVKKFLNFRDAEMEVSQVWADVFDHLRVEVEKHSTFKNKCLRTIYLTYSHEYPKDQKDLLERVANEKFEQVIMIEEARAAAWMLREVENVPNTDIIVVDCGASTVEWCYLQWSEDKDDYCIYPVPAYEKRFKRVPRRERLKKGYKRYSLQIGGVNVDEVLVNRIKERVEEKAGDGLNLKERDVVFVTKQVRECKEEFCNYGTVGSPIKVTGGEVELTPKDIEQAIQEGFIEKILDKEGPLVNFIEDVKDSPRKGRSPAVILVGGGAELTRFDEKKIESTFGCNVTKLGTQHRGDYAPVLGAMYYALAQMQSDVQPQPILTVKDVEGPQQTLIGKDGKEMVLIPGGEFQMGSEDPEADLDEAPVHTVHVDSFYMDKYLVTNAEYKKFVDENLEWQKPILSKKPPWLRFVKRSKWRKEKKEYKLKLIHYNSAYLSHWNQDGYPIGEDDYPVIRVSWRAAMGYAAWVGKRLPTEAEWEKAARGGLSGKKYPWGDTIDSGRANYESNAGGVTSVGSYPPNDYDLYDMAGNVREWCLDEYDEDFYANSPSANPLSGGPTVKWMSNNYRNVNSFRVLRGGSWLIPAQNVRVASRNYDSPAYANGYVGFRCARDVTP